MHTTAQRLRAVLESITKRLEDLIREVPIEYISREQGEFIFVGPEYYWGDLEPSQKSLQIKLKKEYDKFSEIMFLFFRNATKDVIRELEEADKGYRKWLELSSNWSVTKDKDRNEVKLKEQTDELFQLLDILDAYNQQSLILIPDTNSLLKKSDPVAYRKTVSTDSFIFLLLPTVLSELDELKVLHRNESVRDKAKKSIKRIKGWRNQGSLLSGVTIDRTITAKTISNEPNMEDTLSWLDKESPDDRIIASTLEVQSEFPASRVILVTGDINLQNKAEAALIEYSEI